jgi:hypothetical protein
MTQTETVLDTTVHGTPSGNYDGSSQDWYSNAVQAAEYFRGRGGVQSIGITVTGFAGVMTFEATLDTLAADANWFTVLVYGDGSSVPVTDYRVETVTGNFTWIRVRVTGFEAGTINSVTVTY